LNDLKFEISNLKRRNGEIFTKALMIVPVFVLGMILTTFPVLGQAEGTMQKLEVHSSAFGEGDRIPSDFTCDGADMSPPIEWAGLPAQVRSIAIIADDPDARSGDWVHWLVYDLPPSLVQLPAGIPKGEKLSVGGSQGRTDFGQTGYGGPCPPGGEHRYFFKVYALDAMLRLRPGATKKELLKAMQGHILAEGVLMGTYERG
jgi:Raf kinase inhibitor-like YbhB/YbcL family protein